MSSVTSIAISGLNNAAARIANATSNIVNASSTAPLPANAADAYTGFVPQDVISVSQSIDGNNLGVTTSYQPRNPAYEVAYQPDSPQANDQGLVAVPAVDLATEIITSKVAQTDYAASATLIKIEQKNEKALLDIKT